MRQTKTISVKEEIRNMHKYRYQKTINCWLWKCCPLEYSIFLLRDEKNPSLFKTSSILIIPLLRMVSRKLIYSILCNKHVRHIGKSFNILPWKLRQNICTEFQTFYRVTSEKNFEKNIFFETIVSHFKLLRMLLSK